MRPPWRRPSTARQKQPARVSAAVFTALFEAISGEDINRIVAGYALPNPASAALHERFGFRPVGVFSQNGRKFGRYWDVCWNERPLHLAANAFDAKPLRLLL
jgi:L-amino acid N-acyltransferase YncA